MVVVVASSGDDGKLPGPCAVYGAGEYARSRVLARVFMRMHVGHVPVAMASPLASWRLARL
jgi:hypothetical protein